MISKTRYWTENATSAKFSIVFLKRFFTFVPKLSRIFWSASDIDPYNSFSISQSRNPRYPQYLDFSSDYPDFSSIFIGNHDFQNALLNRERDDCQIFDCFSETFFYVCSKTNSDFWIDTSSRPVWADFQYRHLQPLKSLISKQFRRIFGQDYSKLSKYHDFQNPTPSPCRTDLNDIFCFYERFCYVCSKTNFEVLIIVRSGIVFSNSNIRHHHRPIYHIIQNFRPVSAQITI